MKKEIRLWTKYFQERDIVRRVVRLIVAGESVAITEQVNVHLRWFSINYLIWEIKFVRMQVSLYFWTSQDFCFQGREFTTAARYLIKNEQCPNVECVAHMDKFLSKISVSWTHSHRHDNCLWGNVCICLQNYLQDIPELAGSWCYAWLRWSIHLSNASATNSSCSIWKEFKTRENAQSRDEPLSFQLGRHSYSRNIGWVKSKLVYYERFYCYIGRTIYCSYSFFHIWKRLQKLHKLNQTLFQLRLRINSFRWMFIWFETFHEKTERYWITHPNSPLATFGTDYSRYCGWISICGSRSIYHWIISPHTFCSQSARGIRCYCRIWGESTRTSSFCTEFYKNILNGTCKFTKSWSRWT